MSGPVDRAHPASQDRAGGPSDPSPSVSAVPALIPLRGEHQSKPAPAENKFHVGNGDDGKHYWLTPPSVYGPLNARFAFDFDPCPFPKPDGFDGLTASWGRSNYVNPPFGSILHQGPDDKKPRKKGPTAWVRKAIEEQAKGNRTVLVYPVDKWLLMLLAAGAKVENLGDVKWLATEDGSEGKGTGRHIACFILEPCDSGSRSESQDAGERLGPEDGRAAAPQAPHRPQTTDIPQLSMFMEGAE